MSVRRRPVPAATLSIAAGDSVCQRCVPDERHLLTGGVGRSGSPLSCVLAVLNRLEGKERWDPARTGRMAMTGFFLVTPVMHVLFTSFERALPGRALSHLVVKAGLNSMCTVLFIAGSFTGNAFLSNKSIDMLRAQLEER